VIVCKTAQEIEKMREAGRVVGLALKLMGTLVEPGVKTETLDKEAEKLIRKHNAIPTFKGYGGFPASICVSVNEEVVHGIPGKRRLKEGDIVSIDCGATLNGYIGDAALTLPVGRVDPELVALMETTRAGREAGIDKARVGNRLGDISAAVEARANERRFGVVRDYCGHGVGAELHEAPQVPNYGTPNTGPQILKGWAIAIEPMFNLGTARVRVLNDGWTVVTYDGRPSAHFEHSIAVTEKGPVILTLP